MTALERAEKRFERRTKLLEDLHNRLRNGGSFHSRRSSAEGFWSSKDEKRLDEHHAGKPHKLDGWVGVLRQWLPKHSTPQAHDIAAIAAELKNWTEADRVAVNGLAAAARERVEHRFTMAKLSG